MTDRATLEKDLRLMEQENRLADFDQRVRQAKLEIQRSKLRIVELEDSIQQWEGEKGKVQDLLRQLRGQG